MARTARLGGEANPGDAGRDQEDRRAGSRPVERKKKERADTRLREERISLDQARVPGGRRHLLAPRLLSAVALQARRGSLRARLERRLLLPLPRLALRSRRSRLQEQASARQPQGAPAHVPVGHAHPDRRRQEGSLTRWPPPTSNRSPSPA